MRDTDRNRSAVFRKGYWLRVLELLPVMTRAAQATALKNAANNVGRRQYRRYEAAASDGCGPLSIDDADRTAKRYALWLTRAQFDWPVQAATAPPGVVADVHAGITDGIWELDVALRRDVEDLLKTDRQDAARAARLRSLIEAAAGSLAASLDVASTLETESPDWKFVSDAFDEACSTLDTMLAAAGAPTVRE